MQVSIKRIDLFNLDLHQQENGLKFHGHKAGTVVHRAAMIEVIERLAKKWNVKTSVDYMNWKELLKSKVARILRKAMKTERGRSFLSRFIKVPSIFYPRYFREIGGHKFSLWDGEPDIATKGLLEDYKTINEWEAETEKLLKGIITKDMVCLDVGASTGPLTLVMCRQAKHVIAVEPTERCFNYLCRNLELNGYTNCTPLKMAAWNKNEVVKMPMNDPHPIYVNGIVLDDWLEKNGYEKVDFIKMDIDGPEPKALQGLVRTFERNPQLKMIIEYYPKYIVGAGCDPNVFIDILNKYFTYKVVEHDYGDGCWNLICVRK